MNLEQTSAFPMPVRRRMLLCALLAMVPALPSQAQPSATEEAELARLVAFFQAYLEDEFRHRPLEATRLGDHRHDDRLDDISPDARAANVERDQKTLAELPKQVDREELSRAGQIDFEIFEHHLKRSLWLAENTRPFEEDPRTYNDYITECVYLLLTQSTLPRERNVQNSIARMANIPRVIETARKTLENPPAVLVEVASRQIQGAIAFYSTGIFELSQERPGDGELSKAAGPVVEALKGYQKFLDKELLPRAKGEWRIGREKFSRKLELELDAGMSAGEVLQAAEAEAIRVENEMYVIARQLWAGRFPGKSLPPDDEPGRRETVRRVMVELSKEHGEPETLLADVRQTVDSIKAFIRAADILRLPEPDACRIIEMPEFQRGFSVAYLNNAPPLDPRASSYYAISPPPSSWDARRVTSYLEEYNRHMLKILTIHEGYPGHYVQLEYSNRHPSLIRKVLSSGIFAEGWAVYTEQVMLDQGFGGGDPALRLHQLKFYLRAVINAILDHEMHCSGMSDEQALELLTKRGFQSEGEAVGKVLRAKQSSCQLSTYFVGRMAFYRLRQQIQRETGEEFDLGRYHEAVLAHGTLPVKYLPELVRERLKAPRFE